MTTEVLSQLVLGVMAALGEAAAQGLAMGIGVKEHFSLAEAIETGIATGFMAGSDFGFVDAAMEGSLQK